MDITSFFCDANLRLRLVTLKFDSVTTFLQLRNVQNGHEGVSIQKRVTGNDSV